MELDQAQSPLFSRLPGEIRNAIYELCRTDPNDSFSCQRFDPTHLQGQAKSLCALLKTCKRVYKEARSILCDTVLLEAAPRFGGIGVIFAHQFCPTLIRSLTLDYRYEQEYRRVFFDELLKFTEWLASTAVETRHLSIRIRHIAYRFPSHCSLCWITPEPCEHNALLVSTLLTRRFQELFPLILKFDRLQSLEVRGDCRPTVIRAVEEQLMPQLQDRHVKLIQPTEAETDTEPFVLENWNW